MRKLKIDYKESLLNAQKYIAEQKSELTKLENERNDYRDRYESLQGENAELKRDKEDLIFVRNAKADHINELKDQLTKAKEIIERLLATSRSIYGRDEDGEITLFFNSDYEELKKQAEQFIKEIEK